MIELSSTDRQGVVRVQGDIDAEVAPELRDALAWAVDRHEHVVLDLDGAPTLDSAGLSVLIRAHRRARQRGGLLCLVAPSRFVITVLHTMHVDGVFPIFDDSATAEDWMRDQSAVPAGRG